MSQKLMDAAVVRISGRGKDPVGLQPNEAGAFDILLDAIRVTGRRDQPIGA